MGKRQQLYRKERRGKDDLREKDNFNWLLHEVNKVLSKREKKHAHDNDFIRRLSETLWKEALI